MKREKKRVRCPGCGRTVMVNIDGTLRTHFGGPQYGIFKKRCKWTADYPREARLAVLLHDALGDMESAIRTLKMIDEVIARTEAIGTSRALQRSRERVAKTMGEIETRIATLRQDTMQQQEEKTHHV